MTQQRVTNKTGIDLPLAVWLLQNGYNIGTDKAPPGELISATTLLKPTRQLILQRKVDQTQETIDLKDLIASRRGHALHDSVERAWTEGDWAGAMARLHYPQSIIDKVRINPDPKTVKDGELPIYLEKRGYRPFEDVVITGQMDFLVGHAYRDFKSTSTFAWTSGNKDQDYILQGSIYRWIFPDLIRDDVMRIEFIFTDFVKYMTKNPKYPQSPIDHRDYPLMSIKDTETWIHDKLHEIRTNAKKNQSAMVQCTDKELWRGEDSFKYFSDPAKASPTNRATRRFDTAVEAEQYRQEKNKGVVVKVPGEVKACLYCPAFSVCEQRKNYFADDETYIE